MLSDGADTDESMADVTPPEAKAKAVSAASEQTPKREGVSQAPPPSADAARDDSSKSAGREPGAGAAATGGAVAGSKRRKSKRAAASGRSTWQQVVSRWFGWLVG